MRRRSLAIAALILAAPSTARADALDLPPTIVQPGTVGLEQAQRPGYWSVGRARPFIAATVDAGFLYFRPQLELGYGRPHWSWVGVEIFPAFSSGGMVEYIGIRAALPHFEFRGGARYLFTFNRYFLAPRYTYFREDTESSETGQRSRYLALDAEIAATVPLRYGSLFGVATATTVFGVPDGLYLVEEMLRQVMKPPFIGRARLGYALRFGRNDDVSLGAFGEVIGMPGRDVAVARVGPVGGVRVTNHFEIIASFSLVVAARDVLGLAAGNVAQLGVRYRWATGEIAPAFP